MHSSNPAKNNKHNIFVNFSYIIIVRSVDKQQEKYSKFLGKQGKENFVIKRNNLIKVRKGKDAFYFF